MSTFFQTTLLINITFCHSREQNLLFTPCYCELETQMSKNNTLDLLRYYNSKKLNLKWRIVRSSISDSLVVKTA